MDLGELPTIQMLLQFALSLQPEHKKQKDAKTKTTDLIELMAYQTSVSVAPYALQLISALLKLGLGEPNIEEGLALEYVLSLQ